MKRKVLQLLLFAIIPSLITAQEISTSSINSAGTEYSNEETSMNWTIGQTATNTVSSDDMTLTQGFQQNSYTITDISADIIEAIEISVFPNPTSDIVFIELTSNEYSDLIIDIFDISGKFIDCKQITESKNQIQLSQYSSDMFLINIKQDNKILKTYKIIKNQ